MEDLEPLGLRMARKLRRSARRRCRRRSKAMARARSSARRAKSSTARCGMCRAATPCARCWAAPRPSCPRPRRWAVRARGSTCRSPISTPPMCAAISMRSRSGVTDAPRADEIVLALVMTTGPRVHARVGGLEAQRDQGRGRIEMKAKIRKIVTIVDETLTRAGQGRVAAGPPRRMPSRSSPIPLPARYQEDLSDLIDIGEELGGLLAERAVAALGIAGAARSRATARRRRSARMASWNMPRRSCIPSSARRSARCWARARR